MPYVGAGSQSVDRMTIPQPHGQWDRQTDRDTKFSLCKLQQLPQHFLAKWGSTKKNINIKMWIESNTKQLENILRICWICLPLICSIGYRTTKSHLSFEYCNLFIYSFLLDGILYCFVMILSVLKELSSWESQMESSVKKNLLNSLNEFAKEPEEDKVLFHFSIGKYYITVSILIVFYNIIYLHYFINSQYPLVIFQAKRQWKAFLKPLPH